MADFERASRIGKGGIDEERHGQPGRRTLTMRVPARSRSATPVQCRPAAAGSSRADAAETAWVQRLMYQGLRPDLARPIQRRVAADVPADLGAGAPAGAGRPMSDGVQAKMEHAFGADLSAVRIHESAGPATIGAQAYTQGTDIHFASGEYQPETQPGQALLGHELTHVVQQSQGRVRADAQAKGLPINDDPALEREADELGERAARGERVAASLPGAAGGAPAATPAAAPVQASRGKGKKLRTGLAGGLVFGGGSLLLGASMPFTGLALLGGFGLGYWLGGSNGNDNSGEQERDPTERDEQDGSREEDDDDRERDATEPDEQDGSAEEKDDQEWDDEQWSKKFGVIAEHHRRRRKATMATTEEGRTYLHGLTDKIDSMRGLANYLQRHANHYEAIHTMLVARQLRFRSLERTEGADSVKAVIDKALVLVTNHRGLIERHIPAYKSFVENLPTALTKNEVHKKVWPTNKWALKRLRALGEWAQLRASWREQEEKEKVTLAKEYQGQLKKLDSYEQHIPASCRALDQKVVDDVIEDLKQIKRYLRRCQAGQEDKRKAERKAKSKEKLKAKSKAVTHGKEHDDESDDVTDETTDKTIRIMNAGKVNPNTGLTPAEGRKVLEFEQLHGVQLYTRLRDLMNAHFGKFECPHHYTIRLSRAKRLEFDFDVVDDELQITIKNIGKPTYKH